MDLQDVLPGKRIEWLGTRRTARVSARQFGAARILRARVTPLVISSGACERGPSGGLQEGPPAPRGPGGQLLHLVLHLDGVAHYRHEGADDEVHLAGSAVLVDPMRPCAVAHPEGASVAVWSLPRSSVAPGLPDLPPVAPLDDDCAAIVALQARALESRSHRLPRRTRLALLDHFGSLIGLALACCRAEELSARATHAGCRRARVRAYLEARFRDPRLTVARAARDLGMSRRWLQAQFGSGEGFAAALARRRLESGLALLRDPAADHLTVTEIAFAVGFNDLSTFHRRFRSRYGTSPGAARWARTRGGEGRPARRRSSSRT